MQTDTNCCRRVFFPLNMRILYEQGNHAELVINFSDARDVCGHVDMGDVAVKKSDF